jgi:ketosteroid isomerase-like protein
MQPMSKSGFLVRRSIVMTERGGPMPAVADNLETVKGMLDRMLPSGDLGPLLDGLTDDVVFTVATSEDGPDTYHGAGKAAVLDYFVGLGDMIAFWRVTYVSRGARVLVRGEESFTLQPGALAAHREFALLFDLRDGLITRLLVVEDPPALAGASDGWLETNCSRRESQ